MPETLDVGVLLLPPIQLLDVSPVDLFGMTSTDYLTVCGLPPPITKLGLTVTVTYIAPDHPSLTFAECTAGAALRVTANLSTPAVAPGKLDVLMIPGPEPGIEPDAATKAFIAAHAAEKHTVVMTVCTGIFVAGHAGILDGRQCAGPRALVPKLEKLFSEARFVDKRWMVDGNVWCSGGITNGQDMVAAYLRQRWPGPMSNMVCMMADVGDRGQEYGSSKAGETAWVVWQIIKGLFTMRK